MDYLYCHELYHHGMKGMKWGVRRELDEENDGTSHTRENTNERAKLSRNNKIKIGVAITGTILATTGTVAFLVYKKKHSSTISSGSNVVHTLSNSMSLIAR